MMEMIPLLYLFFMFYFQETPWNNNGSGVAARERQALESFGSPGAW